MLLYIIRKLKPVYSVPTAKTIMYLCMSVTYIRHIGVFRHIAFRNPLVYILQSSGIVGDNCVMVTLFQYINISESASVDVATKSLVGCYDSDEPQRTSIDTDR